MIRRIQAERAVDRGHWTIQLTIYGAIGGEKAGGLGSIKTKAPAHKSQTSSDSPEPDDLWRQESSHWSAFWRGCERTVSQIPGIQTGVVGTVRDGADESKMQAMAKRLFD